jgi:hypothetical protein
MTVREAVAEAGENVQDMVAEARAEYETDNPQPVVAGNAGQTANEPRTRKQRRQPGGPQSGSGNTQ